MSALNFSFNVDGTDFTSAGNASVQVKKNLRQLGINAEIIRRVSIAMYEGEINMVIHAGGGEATVTVDTDKVVIVLADNGPGISPRKQKLLFRVGYSTKFNPDTGNISRGVGLPAVQYIVESLGGEIAVDSAPGEGTCFSVTIPLASVTGGNT